MIILDYSHHQLRKQNKKLLETNHGTDYLAERFKRRKDGAFNFQRPWIMVVQRTPPSHITPPEIGPYDQGLCKPLVSLNKALYILIH